MADDSHTPLLTRPPGSSFIKACFNATNAFLGIGLLTVPYALSSGGWLSLLLFFLVGAITFYTGILLKRCMDIDPSIQNYLHIAERAFGRTGKVAVMIIMNCELYLVSIGLLIMEGDNLHKLFPSLHVDVGALEVDGMRSFVVISGLVIMPSMMLTDLGVLSYVSATGVFSCLIILASVVVVGVVDGVGFECKGDVLKWSGVPTAISLYIVCFAGHPVVPSIYTSMEYPHKFSKVLLCSFFLTTLTYLSMATIGYLEYGNNVESQITLNLPTTSVAGNIAIYTTLLIPVTRYALMMTPVANAIESSLSEDHKDNISIRRVIRLALLLSTMVFACLFPYFESLMSIIGSIFVVLASFLLPCLCYLKISGTHRSWSFKLISIVGIVVFATVAGIIGTCSSVVQLIQDM